MAEALRRTWVVIRALITLSVAMECLLIADTKVHRIVVALLILIYVQSIGWASMFGRVMFQDLARLGLWIRQVKEHSVLQVQGVEDGLLLSERIAMRLKERAFDEIVFWIQAILIYGMVLFFLLRVMVV